MSSQPKDPVTGRIIGAAIEVSKTLGHGFLESVYQHALAYEFTERGIPFLAHVQMPIVYKTLKLDCAYRADFV